MFFENVKRKVIRADRADADQCCLQKLRHERAQESHCEDQLRIIRFQ